MWHPTAEIDSREELSLLYDIVKAVGCKMGLYMHLGTTLSVIGCDTTIAGSFNNLAR